MPTEASDLMPVVGARLLKNGERVLVGVGLPNLAANLAKRLHAPKLVLVYESGVIDARPTGLPLSIGDPDLVRTSLAAIPMVEFFAQYLQTGWIDVGFLGGAQIDRRGNLNSTVVGEYERPTVRLSGSGGAADIASFAHRTIIIMPHDLRRFRDRVDFITSPGHPEGRRREGGPAYVVTDHALLDFDDTGEMRLVALYPGVTVEEVASRTGWPIKVAADLHEITPPTAEELAALRDLRETKGADS